MFLYGFEITLKPVVNGLQLFSGTADSKGLVTDAPLPATFSYIRWEDNI